MNPAAGDDIRVEVPNASNLRLFSLAGEVSAKRVPGGILVQRSLIRRFA